MIKNVDNTILNDFSPLIPPKYIEKLESGQLFCLGALREVEDGCLPTGVLLFSVEEGVLNGTEPATMIVLQWFYVSEAHRMEGYANELLDALSDILDDSPAEGIICDIPFDSEYDLAEAFLVSWGFHFEVIDTNEMIITKEDCRRQARSKNITVDLSVITDIEKPKGLLSILDVPEEAFVKAVREAKEQDRNRIHSLISENREDYAGDMSCIIMKGEKISAMVLFERISDGNLHMALLTSFNPDGAKELLKLLRYTAGYYYFNYPEDAEIHLTLGTEKGMNLATHLFPDIDPIQVRRGFFS